MLFEIYNSKRTLTLLLWSFSQNIKSAIDVMILGLRICAFDKQICDVS